VEIEVVNDDAVRFTFCLSLGEGEI
jgi:hypothetical protein